IHKKWTMVLAADDKTIFYESKNLKEWNLLSDFGQNIGAHGGVWECPDLFPLQVQGGEETKWVLLVSINPGGPNGGSATQYFIGDFDGTNFVLDPNFKKELQEEHDFWIDFGKDNYAGVTWSNAATSDNGKYFIGWMSNWQYANEVPTETWRGAMTVARELQLIKTPKSYRLVSQPVDQLEDFRTKKYQKEDISIGGETVLTTSEKINLSSAEIRFKISEPKAGFKYVLSNQQGDSLVFGFKATDRQFYLDRGQAGKVDFSEEFAKQPSTAPRIGEGQGINGIILLDKTSVELFYNDGTTVMTEIFFPNAPFESLSIAPENQEFILDRIEVHELNFN
ncbi:MAG: glycoside hydrolase family 32 protein, partial [Pricia sp.]